MEEGRRAPGARKDAKTASSKKNNQPYEENYGEWPIHTDWNLDEVPTTKRMLRKAEESRSVATEALEQLQHQGEQLDRAESAMARMENDLSTADWLLRGMRSYTGAFVNYFAPPPPPPPPKAEPRRRPVQKKVRQGLKAREDIVIEEDEEWVLMAGGKKPQSQANNRVPKTERPKPKEEWEQQREQDKDLDEIYDVVSDLKEMSLESGKELRRQNEQLDRLNNGMQDLDERVNATNKKVKKYLKGK